MTDDAHQQFECTFQNWLTQQRIDHDEMVQTLAHNPTANHLRLLVDKNIEHFQEYVDKRSAWSQHDAPSICSPSWGTTFEKSCFWIGGCRPSLAIRLVYSLCGSQVKEYLDELPQGQTQGNLGELSARQLKLIDALHAKTVENEKHLSSRMATLQEDIVDGPLAKIARGCNRVGEASQGVDEALDGYALELANLMKDADQLRLATLKEFTNDILTPLQAVELLVALRKLHLSIREWSKKRDQNMGIIS